MCTMVDGEGERRAGIGASHVADGCLVRRQLKVRAGLVHGVARYERLGVVGMRRVYSMAILTVAILTMRLCIVEHEACVLVCREVDVVAAEWVAQRYSHLGRIGSPLHAPSHTLGKIGLQALLTMATRCDSELLEALPTVAILTMAILTMAILTMATSLSPNMTRHVTKKQGTERYVSKKMRA